MGCGDSQGCLGPKLRERAVYLDLIERIHDEASELTLTQENDNYAHIMESLRKSGFLGKLRDNLVTHKADILDCMTQNHEKVLKASSQANKIAGLIVSDTIITIFRETSNRITMSGLLQAPNNMHFDPRLQHIFFQLMLNLFEEQPTLYERQLDSIINLCLLTGNQKLGIKGFFYPVIIILRRKAEEGISTLKTMQVLEDLINRVRDNIRNDEQDQLIFRYCLLTSLSQEEGLKNRALKIILVYLRRFERNYGIIYKQMLKLMCQDTFIGERVKILDERIKQANEKANSQFMFDRGMALEIIKWLKLCEGTVECRINAFHTLSLWLHEEGQQFPQSTLKELFQSFLANIESQKRNFKQAFMELVEGLGRKFQSSLVRYLATAIKDITLSQIHRATMFEVMTDSMEATRMVSESTQLIKLSPFIELQQYFSLKLMTDILSFTLKFIQSVKIESESSTNDQLYRFKRRLCQFLYSIVQQLCHDTQISQQTVEDINRLHTLSQPCSMESDATTLQLQYKQAFLLESLRFLRGLQELKMNEVIILFLKQTITHILFLSGCDLEADPDPTCYFLTSLVLTLLSEIGSLDSQKQRTKSMVELVCDRKSNPPLAQRATSILIRFSLECQQLFNEKQGIQSTKIEAIQWYLDQLVIEKACLSKEQEEQWKEVGQLMSDSFGGQFQANNNEVDVKPGNSNIKFKRSGSVMEHWSQVMSSKEQSKEEYEESFNQIRDRIRQT